MKIPRFYKGDRRIDRRIGFGLILWAIFFCLPAPVFANVDLSPPEKAAWFVDMNRYADAAHASLQCAECHGDMIEDGKPHPNPDAPGFLRTNPVRAFDYGQCKKCHANAWERYMTGGHAKALEKEKRPAAETPSPTAEKAAYPAPTCGNCHSSHYDRSKLSRTTVGKQMTETCGACHPAQTRSYLKNIHGKLAVNLEDRRSAYCSDCHGAHTVVSLNKEADALPVCRRCHPEAEKNFAGFVIHASTDSLSAMDAAKKPAILWIRRIQVIVGAVVGLSLIFFFGHSALWLLREIHEKLRKH